VIASSRWIITNRISLDCAPVPEHPQREPDLGKLRFSCIILTSYILYKMPADYLFIISLFTSLAYTV